MNTTKNFAAAIGTFQLAEIEAGGFVGPCEVADRREREALDRLIATRSPHRAGIIWKIERAAESVRDQRDHFGRLVGELEACVNELAQTGADLAHVADALTVVSRRLEREGLYEGYARLLRSASVDARELVA